MIKAFFRHKRLLAAFLGSCFFVCSCENNLQTVKDIGKKKIGVEEAVNIESFLSQGGRVKAKLSAPYMLRYQFDTPKVEFTKSLHVDFFNENLKIESQLNAKYGNYLENENKVFLRDSVLVFNVSGDTLHTKELYWDQAQEKFYTNKNVILIKPDQKIYGSGLVADQSFKNITINNPKGFILIADSSYVGY